MVTTAGLLHDHLSERFPHLAQERVYHALEEASRMVKSNWGGELRETPASERFRLLADELGLPKEEEELRRELLNCHMGALRRSYIFPPEHRNILANLRKHYRMAIFSNCDYGPVIMELLEENRIADWFDPVVISERIGYRKPGRRAFEKALALTGEELDNIIFVGDSLEDDVAGAIPINLDVAWINLKSEEMPGDGPSPTYILRDLTGLENLLLNFGN